MNLWLRLTYIIVTALLGRRLAMPNGVSALRLRVWPTDLDLNLHLNNGRYLTIMDLGRMDLMIRAGLMRTVLRRRWMPVLTAVSIRYRRSIGPFQRFRLETVLTGWTSHALTLEQRFVLVSGRHAGEVAATAQVEAAILASGQPPRRVAVAEVFEAIGFSAEIPSPTITESFVKPA